jgi:asparagine synthase (glutamine-hydrolysing)
MPHEPGTDRIAIASWLMTAPIPADRTLFDGIAPLPPAARLALTPDAGAPRRYWTPRYRRRSGVTVEEAGAEVRLALERGVRRRMGPPTESALLLSGGIDSASVAGVACAGPEGDPRPGRSYSAVFPRHPRIDEGPLIREIAAALGIRATGLQLNGGGILAGALPYLRAWELTPSTPNLFFLHPLLARAAADGTSVLLDGEGGDAIFWFTTALLADRVKRGRLLSAWSLAGRFPEYGVPTTWRTRVNQLRQWGRPRDFNPPPPAWLTLEAPDASATSGAAPRAEGAPRWWRAHLDAVLGIGSQIVHDTSRRHAALSGIEPRHPLLDVDLIELALSLPPELAFERRYNRPVLRAAVAGLVPDAARLRPYKSNFDVVLFDALAADLPAIERLLLEPGAETPAFADRAGVEAQLAHPPDAPGERREWSMSIWHLTTMECWLRQRAGADPVPPALAPLLAPADYSFIDLR